MCLHACANLCYHAYRRRHSTQPTALTKKQQQQHQKRQQFTTKTKLVTSAMRITFTRAIIIVVVVVVNVLAIGSRQHFDNTRWNSSRLTFFFVLVFGCFKQTSKKMTQIDNYLQHFALQATQHWHRSVT
jgi:hypothetical protein